MKPTIVTENNKVKKIIFEMTPVESLNIIRALDIAIESNLTNPVDRIDMRRIRKIIQERHNWEEIKL